MNLILSRVFEIRLDRFKSDLKAMGIHSSIELRLNSGVIRLYYFSLRLRYLKVNLISVKRERGFKKGILSIICRLEEKNR